MSETKLRHDQPQSMEARVRARLNSSCCTERADAYVVTGSGPTRAATEVYNSFNKTWGSVNKGEGSIDGKPRGVV
jgi:hypothetical protein